MKHLKKLKAMLANEIEAREVYVDGFEAVKELENLDKHKKALESSVKSLLKQEEKGHERAEKAIKEAKRIEADYSDRAVELEEMNAANIKTAEKVAENIVADARLELDGIQAKKRKLFKTIKDNNAAAETAEARLAKATKELEDVRSRLKSI